MRWWILYLVGAGSFTLGWLLCVTFMETVRAHEELDFKDDI